jgi:hypothetical protein
MSSCYCERCIDREEEIVRLKHELASLQNRSDREFQGLSDACFEARRVANEAISKLSCFPAIQEEFVMEYSWINKL